jgi:hypothetical protein
LDYVVRKRITGITAGLKVDGIIGVTQDIVEIPFEIYRVKTAWVYLPAGRSV